MTKYVRFTLNRSLSSTVNDTPEVHYGVLDGEVIHRTAGLGGPRTGHTNELAAIRLLPPSAPTKIVCVGRNYRDHAKELGNEVPSEPLIFLKPPSSLIAAGEDIIYPSLSQRIDFEGELAVVIGPRTKRVTASEALSRIFGYTCLNDVTARDLQKKDGQWTRGKGFDTFCPVGPWVVSAAEVPLESLRVRTLLDGEVKQDAPVTDMIFPVPDIIAYVTQFLTLEAGDLIATGTPAGVGPMQPGSEVHVEIEGIGLLRNTVVRES